MVDGPLELTLRVVRTLEELGIPYVLGGSLASSLVGEPRASADIDLAIRIGADQVAALVRALSRDFYISEEAVQDAVRRGTSFNMVHLESVTKVDLFVLGDDVLDRRQLERRVRVLVTEDPPQQLWIGSLRNADGTPEGIGTLAPQVRSLVQEGEVTRTYVSPLCRGVQ